MDVVIPFINSINGDKELLYALRSAERHIPNLDKAYVIGDVPRWAFNSDYLISVAAFDKKPIPSMKRDLNMMVKIAEACSMDEVSDYFIIMHDDNYLLKDFNPTTYWHQGQVWNGKGDYAIVEFNTRKALGEKINNYDVHAPHCVQKDAFMRAMAYVDWMVPYGYAIKTLYAVVNGITGVYTSDCKMNVSWSVQVIQNMIRGREFFSIGDSAWKAEMVKVIRELYPNKSKYEL